MKKKLFLIFYAIGWPIVAYVVGGLTTLLLSIVITSVVSFDTSSLLWRLLATLLSVVAATTIILWQSRHVDLGIRAFHIKYAGIAIVLLIGLLAISYGLDWVYSMVGIVNESTRNAASFGSRSLGELLGSLMIAGLLTAWLEELLFRGYMYGKLRQAITPVPAALIVSLLFAAMHFSITEIPQLFLVSLSLCWLRHASGSILPGVIVHMGFNMAILTIAYCGL